MVSMENIDVFGSVEVKASLGGKHIIRCVPVKPPLGGRRVAGCVVIHFKQGTMRQVALAVNQNTKGKHCIWEFVNSEGTIMFKALKTTLGLGVRHVIGWMRF